MCLGRILPLLLLICALSISACLSALHVGTEIVLDRTYLRTEQQNHGFITQNKKEEKFSRLPSWKIQTLTWENGVFSGDRGRWIQTCNYAEPDRYINTHTYEQIHMERVCVSTASRACVTEGAQVRQILLWVCACVCVYVLWFTVSGEVIKIRDINQSTVSSNE